MKNKIITISLITLLPSVSAAFFCPNNFNQIDFGYSTDQVIAQCGKPDKQESSETTPDGPQEWVYFIPQSVATNTMNMQQGTLKTSIAFDKDGNAINLSVNGIGVGSSTICGSSIQLGQTKDQIKAACGEPNNIIKSSNRATDQKQTPTKITTFTYNTNPPAKLVFENGLLKSK